MSGEVSANAFFEEGMYTEVEEDSGIVEGDDMYGVASMQNADIVSIGSGSSENEAGEEEEEEDEYGDMYQENGTTYVKEYDSYTEIEGVEGAGAGAETVIKMKPQTYKKQKNGTQKTRPMKWTTSTHTPFLRNRGSDAESPSEVTFNLDCLVPCKPIYHAEREERLFVQDWNKTACESITAQVMEETGSHCKDPNTSMSICGRVEVGIANVFDDSNTPIELRLRGKEKRSNGGAVGIEGQEEGGNMKDLKGVTISYAVVTVRDAKKLVTGAKILSKGKPPTSQKGVLVVKDVASDFVYMDDVSIGPLVRRRPGESIDDGLIFIFACKYCELPCIYAFTVHPIVHYILQRVETVVPGRKLTKKSVAPEALHYNLKKFAYVFPEEHHLQTCGAGFFTAHLRWISDDTSIPPRTRADMAFPFGRSKDKHVPDGLTGNKRSKNVTVVFNKKKRSVPPTGVRQITSFFQKKHEPPMHLPVPLEDLSMDYQQTADQDAHETLFDAEEDVYHHKSQVPDNQSLVSDSAFNDAFMAEISAMDISHFLPDTNITGRMQPLNHEHPPEVRRLLYDVHASMELLKESVKTLFSKLNYTPS